MVESGKGSQSSYERRALSSAPGLPRGQVDEDRKMFAGLSGEVAAGYLAGMKFRGVEGGRQAG